MLLQLLQQVSDAEVQKENVAQQQGLDQQRALDMLPGSFDVMRSVFGDKGPCVKPRSEVGHPALAAPDTLMIELGTTAWHIMQDYCFRMTQPHPHHA